MLTRFTRSFLLLTCVAAGVGAQSGQPLVVSPDAAPCLAVRASADATARRVDCLVPGTKVVGVGSAPYWRHIRLPSGRMAWGAKRFLLADPASPNPVLARAGGTTGTAGGGSSALPDDAWLEIHVVDVGQGDGIWIHTYDDGIPDNGRFEGKNVVIDGGPTANDAKNPFLAYLMKNGASGATIDALFITHPHDDHYPGVSGVLNKLEVCNVYDSGYPAEGPKYSAFLDLAKKARCGNGKATMHVGRSEFGVLDWGSELTAEVLWAWPGSATGLGSGNTIVNNSSIVLKLTYGTQSFLFMGDAEGKERKDSPGTPRFAEARLLAEAGAAKLKSTVLKVAHHGSETSSTIPFINAVDPSIVIVSSGRRSFSGTFLPDSSTLKRYCQHNPDIRIYRTDQDDEEEGKTGANDKDGDHIVVRTNGKVTLVVALSGGKPFSPTACSW